jgi:DNA-directed RNA polymerase specialized sigma subunit, sigma24 homolog
VDFDLKKALRQLDAEHRIVVVLFYYEDLSVKNIAKMLELPQGTVKSRLSRAREKLMRLIKE